MHMRASLCTCICGFVCVLPLLGADWTRDRLVFGPGDRSLNLRDGFPEGGDVTLR